MLKKEELQTSERYHNFTNRFFEQGNMGVKITFSSSILFRIIRKIDCFYVCDVLFGSITHGIKELKVTA